MPTKDARTELSFDDNGLWAIRSASRTVVYLDLDSRQLLRHRRSTSPALPHDDHWVPLVQVTSPRGDHTIRIGDRHENLTDPDGDHHDYRWYIPRVCTDIEHITEDDLPEHARRTPPPSSRTGIDLV